MKRLEIQIAVLLAGVLSCLTAMATSPVVDKGKKKQYRSAPVQILSDTLKVFHKRHSAIFSGNVRAIQGDLHVSCRELTVKYSASHGGKNKGKILSMLFSGDVLITQGARKGHCEQALYTRQNSRMLCTGDPWVIDGNSKIHGDEITYLLDKDEVRVKNPKAVLDVSEKTGQGAH